MLSHFLSLFPDAQVVAIGRVSQKTLAKLGLDAVYIRHPSYGGKSQFVRGIAALPETAFSVKR